MDLVAEELVPNPEENTAEYDVFFGNLHAHTSYSDGVGLPREAFLYARDVADLDFMAITEHNHILGGNEASSEERFDLYFRRDDSVFKSAEEINREGGFVAIAGVEFSSMSKGNHINMYDVQEVINVPNGDYRGMFEWLSSQRDTSGNLPVLQLNHPGLGRFGLTIRRNEYGRDDFASDREWIEKIGGVTSLLELLNGEPAEGEPVRSPQVMEDFYLLYLNVGFRVAPTGNQDNHKANWGTANFTRTGVVAQELTKDSILKAMRARHVYATEDANLKVWGRIDSHVLGDIVPFEPGHQYSLCINIQDEDEPTAIYTIDIFEGVIGEGLAAITHTLQCTADNEALLPSHNCSITPAKPGSYAFVRITQHASPFPDRVWTAPIWFDEP